jgi:hypothetical protein
MAKLRFIHGTITGKLGEFVGSRWKGINYLKTFTPPSNPNTAKQIAVRKVFKAVSLFASALFSNKLLGNVPPAQRMTERNSVFKANKSMFTNKVFSPNDLQVAKTSMQVLFDGAECKFAAGSTKFQIESAYMVYDGNNYTGLKACALVYDFVKGKAVASYTKAFTATPNDFDDFSVIQNAPDNFNTPTGSQLADCRLYVFISGLDLKDKKVISATYSVALST